MFGMALTRPSDGRTNEQNKYARSALCEKLSRVKIQISLSNVQFSKILEFKLVYRILSLKLTINYIG